MLAEGAQLALAGFLASHCGRFIGGAQWRKLSRPVRLVIFAVLLLVGISTGTSVYSIWNAGTAPKTTVIGVVSVTQVQVLNVAVIGLVAVAVQGIMTIRASKVSFLAHTLGGQCADRARAFGRSCRRVGGVVRIGRPWLCSSPSSFFPGSLHCRT